MFMEGWEGLLKGDGGTVYSPASVSAPADSKHAPIRKLDDEQQIVYGEVYAPGYPDSQGDYMSSDEIRKMAHAFLKNGYGHNIDTEHSQDRNGSYVVESFIARKGDPDFIEGSWVLGVKVPDRSTWGLIKSGELNGYSLDGSGVRLEKELEMEIPEEITGETSVAYGHKHRFTVRYDDRGNFLGGQTAPAPDGHYHRITRGTVTDDAAGHNHRFSFVEGVLNARS